MSAARRARTETNLLWGVLVVFGPYTINASVGSCGVARTCYFGSCVQYRTWYYLASHSLAACRHLGSRALV